MIVKGGSTDVTTYFNMRLLTTGAPATGLTISDFDMQYVRTRETETAKVDAVALAATNTAHTDSRGIEVDSTDQKGLYRFDWPDAAFAAGTEVILSITHASCFTEHLRVELVGYSPTDGVRLGLTALPNAAADAAGGLPISDAGGLDLDAKVGALTFTVANQVDANVKSNAGSAITAASGIQEVKVASIANNAITTASINNDAITDAKVAADVTIASVTGAVGSVTGAVGSVTGNVGGNVVGSVGSVVGAVGSVTGAVGSVTGNVGGNVVGSVASVVGAVGSVTGNVGGNVTGTVASVLTIDEDSTTLDLDATIRAAVGLAAANLDTQLSTIDDLLDTEVAAIKAKTDNLPGSPAAVGSAMTLTAAYDFAKGTAAMTESYAADGAAPTPVQALFLIQQMLTEFGIVSTTLTVNKLDGTTSAATFTLDSDTSPTSITRAT